MHTYYTYIYTYSTFNGQYLLASIPNELIAKVKKKEGKKERKKGREKERKRKRVDRISCVCCVVLCIFIYTYER